MLDVACSPDTYEHYGVDAKNRSRLVGPGFGLRDNPEDGVRVLNGGRFPSWLSEVGAGRQAHFVLNDFQCPAARDIFYNRRIKVIFVSATAQLCAKKNLWRMRFFA